MCNYTYEIKTYGADAETVSNAAYKLSLVAHGLFGLEGTAWETSIDDDAITLSFLRRSDRDAFVERLEEFDCRHCGTNSLVFDDLEVQAPNSNGVNLFGTPQPPTVAER
jgi:hypothetical protein